MVMPWRVFVTVGLASLEVWTTSQPGRLATWEAVSFRVGDVAGLKA